ncbi:uncharacterized protein LDX57_009016 [Aspergillus melleus]|uniref:uncharacterized protein n=1 Tax=Aspergillus melleus TaxID=138277 RepID=UPI001E8DFA3F|nr:uncharacterized protein LDX57_009016 [Aspergillus melleus]KAH8431358.1 hypothetical protein LDX57_009016 [Aspergillus melleus]
MLDTNNSIALTAFTISLIALAVALLQLLQQYFATAQGYNRCSRRFIGSWSRFRHRHYLWREFRFEVTFVRPYIYLGNPKLNQPSLDVVNSSAIWLHLFPFLQRDRKWRAQYLRKCLSVSDLAEEFTDAHTHASWTLFMKHLQEYNEVATRRIARSTSRLLPPSSPPSSAYSICIKFEPCIWDDLPGNTGRLTGSVSLRDLTVLTRFLGLAWSERPFPFAQHPASAEEESRSTTSYPSRGILQASGNTLTLSETSTPLLRYEQQDTTPPRLRHLSRREAFIIHPGTVAMFYGRMILDSVLFPSPAFSQPLILDGDDDRVWKNLSNTMWLPVPPRPNLVNILPALCSTILSQRDLYPVRVPKPHRYLLGPFTRPKIAMIFKRGVEDIQTQGSSRIVDGILEAIKELEQISRPPQQNSPPPAPLTATTTTFTRIPDYWKLSQGAHPAWATDLGSNNPEAMIFYSKVHRWLNWIQHELSQFLCREDSHIGPYTFFHWDLISSFVEYIVATENGEADTGHGKGGFTSPEAAGTSTATKQQLLPHSKMPQGNLNDKIDQRTRKTPFSAWRRNMKVLFDHFPTIEDHVRKRGKRRAEMHLNGYGCGETLNLGDPFDVLISCEGVVGYSQVNSEEIRDALVGHRCHYMHPDDQEPFQSEFYGDIRQVGIE